MSTLAEIESAVVGLPRTEQAELLRFVAERLGAGAAKTGGELARLWPKLPHLSPAEAEALERDLTGARASESPQPAPSWE